MTLATLKLWEVGDQLQAIAEALLENGGELTPELESELGKLEGMFEAKVERCVLYIRNLEATSDAAKQEARRLTDLASQRQKAADSLKAYVKGELERAKRPKVETDLIIALVQKNSIPSVTYSGDLETLPTAYVRITKALDAKAIVEAWKAQQSLPVGISVEVGTHLRVR